MSANRAREIFVELVSQLPQDQWEARLAELAGEDVELKAKVASLLAASRQADSFLEQPAPFLGKTIEEVPVSLAPGKTSEHSSAEHSGLVLAGRYKLLEQIGEGGMGAVWMAHQTAPVKRTVAVKLIKSGMDSRAVLARFEAERQALALMDHPNIAKVFDAGTTPDGRPFFVMELVKGVPITKFCDEHHLTPRQRLELFIPLCHAIQHAHQKSVIHRDIKPSNVLVALYDDRPVPKVIDFGVAKATAQQLTEQTVHTGFGVVVGTFEYMSPEQATFNQLDIDTRSDIYALGILLYELLTGSPPFNRKMLEKVGLMELLRVIREQEPPKPSTKLSTADGLPALAANRGTEPAKLTRLVRGELDWIVMKALEKDRSRRYETANGFAQDVQRYLNDEPVQACPPSARYRLWKFLRRHKGPVWAATLVAVALLAGLIASLYFAFEADARARDFQEAQARADTEAKSAREEKVEALAARDRAQHLVYVTRMSPVPRLWREGKRGRVLEVLEQQRPAPGEKDLRGFEWHHQWRMCHNALTTLIGHESKGFRDGAEALAFSLDGRLLASGGGKRESGGLILWDMATGRELRRFPGHKHKISGVAFNPDGRTLASIGWDSTVRLWDTATGRLLHALQHETDADNTVAFSPDGKQLLSLANLVISEGGANRSHASVKLWDVASGRELGAWQTDLLAALTLLPDGNALAVDRDNIKLREPATGKELRSFPLTGTGRETVVAVNGDGSRLAVAGETELALWDVGRGVKIRSRRGLPAKSISHLAFSPDGWHVASCGSDGTVSIWDLRPRDFRAPTVTRVLEASGDVNCVAFSPDGLRLAAAGDDGPVRILDAGATGQETRRAVNALVLGDKQLVLAARSAMLPFCDSAFVSQLGGPRGGGGPIAFSADGRLIASQSRDGVRIWNADTFREVRTIPCAQPASALAFTKDGQLAATLDAGLRVWDPGSGRELRSVSVTGHARVVRNVLASPDGQRLAALSGDTDRPSQINVWDAATGKELLTFKTHTQTAVRATYSPDGRLLAAIGLDETWSAKVWDAASGQEVRKISWPTGQGHAVTISADSRLLAVATDQYVKVWNLADGREVFSHKAETGQGLPLDSPSVAFSPDSRQLAASHLDGIKVWDLSQDTGRERLALKATANHLVFSPDGRKLAGGNWSGHGTDHWYGRTLRVWEVASGQELCSLGGHNGGATCMAFSPDKRTIATGGADRMVRVWDATNWEPLRAFPGHTAAIRVLAFSPDGKLVVSGDGQMHDRRKPASGEVRVWDVAGGREAHCLGKYGAGILTLAFRKDGSLVCVSADGVVSVWDAALGQELSTANVGLKHLASVALSPNGGLLACASGDRNVLLWQIEERREVRTLTAAGEHKGRRGYPRMVAFSPDGRRLATASDEEIKLWDVTTGEEVYSIPVDGPGSALAFSPDGGQLVVAAPESDLRVWDGRPLTEELAVEREALGILDQLFGRPLPRQAVVEHLRANPALSDLVRRRALELAPQYAEEPRARRYTEAAQALAQQANLSAMWYQQALRQAEAACALAPADGFCPIVLGMAQYRMGKFPEALETLSRADGLKGHPYIGPLFARAFLALTCHRLGQQDAAQAQLARLQEVMKDRRWQQDYEAHALLREVEKQIGERRP